MLTLGFHVGVVTFSDEKMTQFRSGKAGESLVIALLTEVFFQENKDRAKSAGQPFDRNALKKQADDTVSRIHVAAAFPQLRNMESGTAGQMPNSKEWHIKEVLKKLDVTVKNEQIILFDDTDTNIKEANSQGVHAYLVSREANFTMEIWKHAMEELHKTEA
jgi:Acid Phosphatase